MGIYSEIMDGCEGLGPAQWILAYERGEVHDAVLGHDGVAVRVAKHCARLVHQVHNRYAVTEGLLMDDEVCLREAKENVLLPAQLLRLKRGFN
ncbi:hypothetical protein PRIPAC_88454 [Pristionchus pacificus]|nr:hypothetical protein PRIPAC_88454 [Pristionchus pacificus]|eukprot:PDM60473.1 hypothetical protein PRIPAC_53451 [Pristionchus pacificus]